MNIKEMLEARVIATSFEDSFLVESYPYGRKRTQRRSWIETNKTHGDRVCHCTLNPKTQKWNKPKKSTYDSIKFLYIDNETGYIQSCGDYFLSKEDYNYLVNNMELSPLQQRQVNQKIAINKVMERVTFKCEVGGTYNLSDPEDLARMKADTESPEAIKKEQEQKEIKKTINKHINYEFNKLQNA